MIVAVPGRLHALTAGAYATMILAVMTRAALGHTGRPLAAAKPIVADYVLVTLAALTRVFTPSSRRRCRRSHGPSPGSSG